VEQKLHATIKKVTEDVASLQYNTAIAAMMECLNVIRSGGRDAVRAEVEPLVVMIAPFAPHMAEELWERLGHADGLFEGGQWPAFDPAKLVEETVQVAVQVNGKLRGTIGVPKDTPEAEVIDAARGEDNVARHLEGTQERRVIYVKERLVNFVVA